MFEADDLTTNLGNVLLPVRVWDGPLARDGCRTATDRMRLDAVSVQATTLPANLEIEVWSRYCDTPGRQLAAVALAVPALTSSGLLVAVSVTELVPSWEIRARLTAGVGSIKWRAIFDRRGAPAAVTVGALNA